MRFTPQGVSKVESDDEYKFTLFAPEKETVELLFEDQTTIEMTRDEMGYWHTRVSEPLPSTRYKFVVDGKGYPDPASHYQPEGVHGFSEIIDHDQFDWTDQEWTGITWQDLIIYELHPGTFTQQGGFAGIQQKLPHLKELGVTAIEIMPVAQCPGNYNWGYDGALLFAVQNTYGSPQALKELVNACHDEGIAVILDCVFNHLGPEGAYQAATSPVFNDRYSTPWGPAINYDNAYNYGIRQYVTQNIRYWIEKYHIDGFRLDAIDDIYDRSAYHILEEIQDTVSDLAESLQREIHVIAETAIHDPMISQSQALGGYGMSGQWQDEFHHIMNVLLTGETDGYYGDYQLGLDQLKDCFEGFVYQYEYSPHRKAVIGYPPTKNIQPDLEKLVVCIQNHDQIGNRFKGDRLTETVSDARIRVGAGIMLLSPFTPMLFMGEEFASDDPFYFFVDFSKQKLIEAVRKGRKRDYEEMYNWTDEPVDPVDPESFQASKLSWDQLEDGVHMFEYYKTLIEVRRSWLPESRQLKMNRVVDETFIFSYQYGENELVVIANLGEETSLQELGVDTSPSTRVLLDSTKMPYRQEHDNQGTIADESLVVLLR